MTAKPPSLRDANVGGGHALLETLEAEIAAIEAAESEDNAPAQVGGSWQYVLLAILGGLLFAGGAAFSMMLG